MKYIKLFKPEGSSLGFSVVGLKSAHKGELGIYVQEIQPQGIAGKDGRLQEGDQVKKQYILLSIMFKTESNFFSRFWQSMVSH